MLADFKALLVYVLLFNVLGFDTGEYLIGVNYLIYVN